MGIFSWLFKSKDNTALQQAIKDGAYLVDVRSVSEFKQQSVEGAINIPVDKIGAATSKLKSKKCVVVFCRSGMRSKQAQMILKRNGLDNVLNGGTWQKVNRLKNE